MGRGTIRRVRGYRSRAGMRVVVQERDQDRLLRLAGRRLCEKVRGVLAIKPQAVLGVPGGRSAAAVFQAMLEEELDWRPCTSSSWTSGWCRSTTRQQLQAAARAPRAPLAQAGRLDPGNAHPFVLDPRARSRREALRGRPGEARLSVRRRPPERGEDGHVGALFPRHHSVEDRHHGFLVMHDSPKPPPGRMTASRSLLQTAGAAVVLFVGEAKREAYERFDDETCPWPAARRSSCWRSGLGVFTDSGRAVLATLGRRERRRRQDGAGAVPATGQRGGAMKSCDLVLFGAMATSRGESSCRRCTSWTRRG